MKNFDFKKQLLPHLLVIIGFLAISIVYFRPALDGKVIKTNDIKQHKGMAREVLDFRDSTGEVSLWTNTMFGGMPTYQIATPFPNSLYGLRGPFVALVKDAILPFPINILFLCFLGGYLLMLAFGIDWRIAILGGLTYGFLTYNLYSIEAGHNTKTLAIALAPFVVAGVRFTLSSSKWILGAALTGIALAFQLKVNHVQITYYTGFVVIGLAIAWAIEKIRTKEINVLLTRGGVLLFAAIIGIGSNASNLMTSAEYAKETTRGRSELTLKNENKSSGLSENYATQWSYGVAETWTLLIPNFMGGGSANEQDISGLNNARNGQGIMYWGNQPFAAGPVYVGAIICFLFLIGALLVQFKTFAWLYWITFLGMALSWGRNDAPFHVSILAATGIFLLICYLRKKEFEKSEESIQKWLIAGSVCLGLSLLAWWSYTPNPDPEQRSINSIFQLFFYYMPGFNKFRTVSMSLTIVQITIPILALLGLNELVKMKLDKEQLQKVLLWAGGVPVAICLVFMIAPGMFFDFSGSIDQQQLIESGKYNQQQLNSILSSLVEDRKTLLNQDAIRSIIFMLLAAGGIFALYRQMINRTVFTVAFIALVGIDMSGIALRYLGHDEFEHTKQKEAQIAKTADNDPMKIHFAEIVKYEPQQVAMHKTLYQLKKQDPGHYRVFNEMVNPFSDATTSYFHSSIGGYHGSKPKRFQELLDYRINAEWQRLRNSRYQDTKNLPVLNMMNTKYFLVQAQKGKPFPVPNPDACGNAWFVNKVEYVENADAEIQALDSLNPKNRAIVDKRFKDKLNGFTGSNVQGSIKLVEYKPNYLRYESDASQEGFALFSEAYYRGNIDWVSTIDKEEVDHVRADYHIRGMMIPAGKHIIEFKFDPPTYYRAERYSLISSILLILILIGGIARSVLKGRKVEEQTA